MTPPTFATPESKHGGRPCAPRQLQPAQLERTQPPQLEPLDPPPPEESPELFDDPPIANVEKALRHFLQPHSGQQGFLSRFERTKTSKRLPQRSQSYSKIGIGCPSPRGAFSAHRHDIRPAGSVKGADADGRDRRFRPSAGVS